MANFQNRCIVCPILDELCLRGGVEHPRRKGGATGDSHGRARGLGSALMDIPILEGASLSEQG